MMKLKQKEEAKVDEYVGAPKPQWVYDRSPYEDYLDCEDYEDTDVIVVLSMHEWSNLPEKVWSPYQSGKKDRHPNVGGDYGN